MSGAIKIGPWGGDDGVTKDFGAGVHITSIQVHAGDVVDSIKFTYKRDGSGPTQTSTIGGPGGDPFPPIHLPEGNYITTVTGTVVEYRGRRCVSALTFLTNNEVPYGPYGRREEGFDFTLPIENGKVVGFFGRVGKYINALGIYITPVE